MLTFPRPDRYNAFIQRGVAPSFAGPFAVDAAGVGQSFMPGAPPRFDATEVRGREGNLLQ